MKLKKKLLTGLAILVGIVFVSGVSIYAATNYGSSSDPLVTVSYLENKFTPELKKEIESGTAGQAGGYTAELADKVQQLQKQVDALSGSASPSVDTFSVVALDEGQTLTCKVGAELLLRIGTAVAYGPDDPSLVDTTYGSTLSSGGAMAKNHMYMVTIADNGMKATSFVKVLVRGSYTIN